MRLELRKSGEEFDASLACVKCGATPLIETKEGDRIVRDIAALVEEEAETRFRVFEHELRAELDRRVGEERAIFTAQVREAERSLDDAKVSATRFERLVVERLEAITENDVSRWRRLKLRRERILRERVQAVIDVMLEDTRRV